jgi:Putative peptidoglycan-binding domain-containing protein
MTALHRDLSAPELWHRSLERSCRRRVTAPKLRRQAARRRRASTAMAAAMLASPAASLAAAQSSASSGSSGSSGSGQTGIAAESPANRAIAGGSQSAAMLRLGSTGRAVADVQRELGMEVDGIFGRSTDQSVRVFQGNEGLAVDGIVGPQTRGALFGSGGGTGPAADSGGPDLDIEPAAANDRTPVGNRTQFAVRMAAETELDENERAGLRAAKAAAPQESEDDGGLVAIEFHAPEARAPEVSSESEPSGDDDSVSSDDEGDSVSARSDSGSSDGADSDEEGSVAPSAPKGEDREDPDSGVDNAKSEDKPKSEEDKPKSEDKPTSEEDKPKSEPNPKPKSEPKDDKGSGDCSNKLRDPLSGKGTRTSNFGQRNGRVARGSRHLGPERHADPGRGVWSGQLPEGHVLERWLRQVHLREALEQLHHVLRPPLAVLRRADGRPRQGRRGHRLRGQHR